MKLLHWKRGGYVMYYKRPCSFYLSPINLVNYGFLYSLTIINNRGGKFYFIA